MIARVKESRSDTARASACACTGALPASTSNASHFSNVPPHRFGGGEITHIDRSIHVLASQRECAVENEVLHKLPRPQLWIRSHENRAHSDQIQAGDSRIRDDAVVRRKTSGTGCRVGDDDHRAIRRSRQLDRCSPFYRIGICAADNLPKAGDVKTRISIGRHTGGGRQWLGGGATVVESNKGHHLQSQHEHDVH